MTDARILDEHIDGLSHAFRVSLDAGRVDTVVDARLREMGRTAVVPGFRPGRAPLAFLRNQLGRRVRTAVVDRMAIDVTRRLIAEKGLEPSRRPTIEIDEDIGASPASVTFTLSLEVAARVELAPLSGIRLRRLHVQGDDPALALQAEAHLRRQLFDALMACHDFAVPMDMVNNEYERISRGFETEVGEAVDAELESELRQIATRRVRLAVLLAEIGRTHDIRVPRAEVEALVERQSERDPGHEAEIIDYYLDHPTALAELQSPLFEDRVVKFLLAQSDIEEVDLSAKELQDELDGRAVAPAPDVPGPQVKRARAQLAQQDLQSARRSVEELERQFPEAAVIHLLAGHVHKAQGDTTAAGARYARALELQPTLGEALYNLVDLAPSKPGEAMAAHAAELALRDDLSAPDRINASFAHARLLDRAGRYRDAFEYLRRANKLARDERARQRINYVPSRVEARITGTIAENPAWSFRSAIDPLPVDLKPIFVIGLPRSGTTLIEQILASHGDVQTGGELVVARECEHDFRRQRADAGGEGPIDPADAADSELLAAARERYVDALFERDLNGPWVVDKLPANFEIAGFLRLLFPTAPIVHSVRDPRATCFSLYAANFGAHEPWYNDLGDLAHYFGQYKRLMAHWHSVIPAPFIDVVYEDLVTHPETQIAALLKAIRLPFQPECLEFHRHERPIFTASHAEVRRPVYTSAIDHWRHYADWLGPLRELSPE